jgi:hypothetical protein
MSLWVKKREGRILDGRTDGRKRERRRKMGEIVMRRFLRISKRNCFFSRNVINFILKYIYNKVLAFYHLSLVLYKYIQ